MTQKILREIFSLKIYLYMYKRVGYTNENKKPTNKAYLLGTHRLQMYKLLLNICFLFFSHLYFMYKLCIFFIL